MPRFKNVTGQTIPITAGGDTITFAPGAILTVREEQCAQLRGNGSFREMPEPVPAPVAEPAEKPAVRGPFVGSELASKAKPGEVPIVKDGDVETSAAELEKHETERKHARRAG